MTEQNQNPASTDDVEGHGRGMPSSEPDRIDGWGADLPDDDVQGHFRREAQDSDTADDDVQGHTRREAQDSEDADDVQGHLRAREAQDSEDADDDVQGHNRMH